MSRRGRTPPIFVDTAALLALVNRDDALHARASLMYDQLEASGSQLLTSDWVLTEFLNSTAGRRSRLVGIKVVDTLLSSPRVTVWPASRAAWRAAFALYSSRSDKDWSLVDCASILLCQEQRIETVFTHDRHFQQAGFQVLLQ